LSLANTLVAERYRVERLLARGGMADVYLATDERLDRQVALKVIYPHLAENPSFRDRFIQEAKMAAKLSHPNLVNVFDQGTDGNTTFLVMEYVPGITLREALSHNGKLAPNRALTLFSEVLEGLAAAHRGGILHRDLKPENVLLADDGRIKLGDFGLARELDSNTNTGSLIGTIAYLSPELITRGYADARSDVYAAGILLFELITGEQPFKGNEAAHIAHQHTSAGVPAPSSVDASIPPLVDELVLWATAMAPEHRPANAGELLEVVRRVRADLKNGLGATAHLDLSQLPSLNAQATKVFSTSDATQIIGGVPAADSSSAATTVLGGFEGQATEAIDPASNATTVLGSFSEDAPMTPLEELAWKRSRRGKLLAILIAAAAMLSLGAGWWFGAGPGGLSAMPNLAGTSVESAQENLRPYAAKIVIKQEYSKTVSAGLITHTDPSSGSLFWRGSTITIFESKGPELRAVPSIEGLSVAQATSKLQAAGFLAGTTTQYFSSGAVGTVFSFLGSDGSPVAVGTKIPMLISLGPVPDVAGQSQANAISALQGVGLKVSAVTSEYSDAQTVGMVIRADQAENPLPAGGKVVLVVSKGPTTVKMPAVKGETIAATKLALENLGLNVQVNTDQLQTNWGLVKVKSVSVAAGTVVKRGTLVTISNK
jgi:serine/threonine-protein kinase